MGAARVVVAVAVDVVAQDSSCISGYKKTNKQTYHECKQSKPSELPVSEIGKLLA